MVVFNGDEEVLTRVQARPPSPPPMVMVSAKGKSSGTTGLRQVLSAPTLTRKDQPMEAEAKARLAKFRNGMDADKRALDAAAAIRKRNQQDAEYAAKADLAMRRGYQKAIDASRAHERPAWSPVEAMEYFSVPGAERGGSSCCVKNERVQGIYDVPNVAPPHKELDAVCGWAHSDATLREFGPSLEPLLHEGPGEPKFEAIYADKLERVLSEIREAEREELVRFKEGKRVRAQQQRMKGEQERRRRLEQGERRAKAMEGEYSTLSRENDTRKALGEEPWATRICCPTYFSSPEQGAVRDECDPGLKDYIEQPDRTTSRARDIVIGDPQRTSHWVPRTGGAAGTSGRLAKAQELMQPACMRNRRQSSAPTLMTQR